jgi:hypothetical protein
MMRPGVTTRMHAWAWTALAVCVASAALVYLNALHNPFVYDDHRVVADNPSIVSLANWRAILIYEPARPIVNISYALDRAFWGPAPLGFHVTNLLLHLINVGLIYIVGWRLGQDWKARSASFRAESVKPEIVGFSAALIFAIHPIQTEAVGYISGRSELLCGLFMLAAFLAMRRWMLDRRASWIVATGVFWLLALASKEIAVMFPLLVVAYDVWVRPGTTDERRDRLRRIYLPFGIVACVAVAARIGLFYFREHGDAVVHWQFALLEVAAVRIYLALVFVPIGQTIFHDVPQLTLHDPFAISSLLFLAGLIGLMVWLRKRQGLVVFGFLWFLLLLVPSSALVLLDRGEPMAEHRVYLASMGLFLAMGQAIGWLGMRFSAARPVPRWILRTAVVLGVVSLVGHTIVRNEVWASPVTLWAEAVDDAPRHWLPRLLLGEALHEAGAHEEAVKAFESSLQLRPENLETYTKLGMCEIETNKLDDAKRTFAALQARDPDSTDAIYGFGTIALVEGQPEIARARYLDVIRRDPRNVQARRGLAVLEETVGNNPAEALRRCREIQEIAPATPGNDDCIARNQARVAGGGSNAR